MIFSGNVRGNVREEIMTLWDATQSHHYEKYLGLPPFIGKYRRREFSKIKGKLWQRLHLWKGKFLLQGGKEVLIKSVTLAIPTFAMGCFMVTRSLCIKLEMMVA